jgi:hypothetical protein
MSVNAHVAPVDVLQPCLENRSCVELFTEGGRVEFLPFGIMFPTATDAQWRRISATQTKYSSK